MTGIALIVGLGNPGAAYENNRHNVGFWFVDMLAREYGAELRQQNKLYGSSTRMEVVDQHMWLFKPDTYMNKSGRALQVFMGFHKIGPEQILVAHDEIDFPLAQVRLKHGGGHGGHNGVRDVIACIGADFWRLRIGVGHPGSKRHVVSHVLGDASEDEVIDIRSGLKGVFSIVPQLVRGEFDTATHRLHARDT